MQRARRGVGFSFGRLTVWHGRRKLGARQLIRRIEQSMHEQFCNHQELVELKDSKKAVKEYNTIGCTVDRGRQFEALCLGAMGEAAKSELQSTLFARHSSTEQLYVNFDHQILEGGRVPAVARARVILDSAKTVLILEDKYKHHYNLLSYALVEYELTMANVPEFLFVLLKPHIADTHTITQRIFWKTIIGYLCASRARAPPLTHTHTHNAHAPRCQSRVLAQDALGSALQPQRAPGSGFRPIAHRSRASRCCRSTGRLH